MLCKERRKYVKITWLFSPSSLISPVDAEKENWSGDAEQPGNRVDQDDHTVGHSANFLISFHDRNMKILKKEKKTGKLYFIGILQTFLRFESECWTNISIQKRKLKNLTKKSCPTMFIISKKQNCTKIKSQKHPGHCKRNSKMTKC